MYPAYVTSRISAHVPKEMVTGTVFGSTSRFLAAVEQAGFTVVERNGPPQRDMIPEDIQTVGAAIAYLQKLDPKQGIVAGRFTRRTFVFGGPDVDDKILVFKVEDR